MLAKIIAAISIFIISLFFSSPPAVPVPTPAPALTPTPVVYRLPVKQDVPFTSQAPNYDWKDPRLQDGCEETSILMAYYWAKNKTLSPQTALTEIISQVDYQKQRYGEYRDTSLSDTAQRLLKGYYLYDRYKIYDDVSLNQIIDQLYQGHLVILPMNGQLLHDPNYTGAGPERHMLVLIGYDPKTQEFITNDSGTWRGKDYRFPRDLIYSAICDYLTGYHLPIPEVHKNMLVVF